MLAIIVEHQSGADIEGLTELHDPLPTAPVRLPPACRDDLSVYDSRIGNECRVREMETLEFGMNAEREREWPTAEREKKERERERDSRGRERERERDRERERGRNSRNEDECREREIETLEFGMNAERERERGPLHLYIHPCMQQNGRI